MTTGSRARAAHHNHHKLGTSGVGNGETMNGTERGVEPGATWV
jgi:hypothetical protein